MLRLGAKRSDGARSNSQTARNMHSGCRGPAHYWSCARKVVEEDHPVIAFNIRPHAVIVQPYESCCRVLCKVITR
jgi:hypothetical protein